MSVLFIYLLRERERARETERDIDIETQNLQSLEDACIAGALVGLGLWDLRDLFFACPAGRFPVVPVMNGCTPNARTLLKRW